MGISIVKLFHENSYGYHPLKSAHQALITSRQNVLQYDWVIDMDIKGFFDNINHELMMKAVKHYCPDAWVLMYVERWLKAGIIKKDGNFTPSQTGTPQGGVISPLLANIFLHVAFDRWMELNHPEKKFERYADDIVVHCRSEKQAIYMVDKIRQRMTACCLTLHPEKTKIINLRGLAVKEYPKGFDFLGFTIKPEAYNHKGKIIAVPGIYVSRKSKTSIGQKIRDLNIHKWRTTLEHIAHEINPIISGIINYYHKFRKRDMKLVWLQLNGRLLKWIKWEKGLESKAAGKYLQTKFKENPNLFAHWGLVHP